MPAHHAFEYAILRIVPRVEREEFVNVGVVLFCRTRRFLGAQIVLDEPRLAAFAPTLDLERVREQLSHVPLVCAGGPQAGPIGMLEQQERFRWLVAPRSTIVQPSPVHCGMCSDAQLALDRLVQTMVVPLSSASAPIIGDTP